MLQTFSLACFAACISALTLEGQLTADAQIESQAFVEAASSDGVFFSTLRVGSGMDPGAPTFLSVGTDCNHMDDIHLSYGDDRSGRMTWWFFPDGDFYRIRNAYMTDHGCEHNAWLRANQSCGDRNARRDIYYHQSLWKLQSTDGGFYNLISQEKERFCQYQTLSVSSNGQEVDWYLNDRSGRQVWALQIPVANKAKEIHTIIGSWQLFASGSSQIVGELSRSVADSKGEILTNESTSEWSLSAKVEVETSVGFWGAKVSAKAELEGGGGAEELERKETQSQITNATESRCKATCAAIEGKRAYLYQFVREARAHGPGDFMTASTCHYACTYDLHAYPKCRPRDCANKDCTQCTLCKECEKN